MDRRELVFLWSVVLFASTGTVFFIRHIVAPPQPPAAIPTPPAMTIPAPAGKVIWERSLTPIEVVEATKLLQTVQKGDIPTGWQAAVVAKTWGRTVDGLNEDVMVVLAQDGWRVVESGPRREWGPLKGEEARLRNEEETRNQRLIAALFCPGDLVLLNPAAYGKPDGSKWYFQDGQYRIVQKHVVRARVLEQ